MNVVILGAGAWGSAMAIHLNRCGQRVTLIPRRLEQALDIATSRENKVYLPGVAFPQDIQLAANAAPALTECDVLVFACPSKALRATAEGVKAILDGNPRKPLALLVLCKGLEADSFLPPESVLSQVLPGIPTGTISGPTNAAEVAAGLPVAVVFASTCDEATARQIQQEFSNATFRVYRSSDVIGVELGGSLKNIYAIAAGICDGMKLGANARASLLTRALTEMSRLIASFGGNAETVQGLSGMGDLIATATADWSRNRQFGLQIGREGIRAAMQKMSSGTSIVEGYYATKNFYEYAQSKKIPAPILQCVHAIVYCDVDPRDAIDALMTRDLKSE